MVDGRLLPALVAGHPALELCNTRGGWGTDHPNEYLVDVRALIIWSREVGVLSPAEAQTALRLADASAAPAGAVLRRSLDLRAHLYATLTADDAAARTSVHRYVRRAVSRSSYVAVGGHLVLDGGPGLAAIVNRLALASHRLFEQDGLDSVVRCAGVGCGWLFLDPAHRRRWCVMAVCGNRAKARRHADRQRAC
jgi:predicted RNA-binding Zn ribbon-like protein